MGCIFEPCKLSPADAAGCDAGPEGGFVWLLCVPTSQASRIASIGQCIFGVGEPKAQATGHCGLNISLCHKHGIGTIAQCAGPLLPPGDMRRCETERQILLVPKTGSLSQSKCRRTCKGLGGKPALGGGRPQGSAVNAYRTGCQRWGSGWGAGGSGYKIIAASDEAWNGQSLLGKRGGGDPSASSAGLPGKMTHCGASSFTG